MGRYSTAALKDTMIYQLTCIELIGLCVLAYIVWKKRLWLFFDLNDAQILLVSLALPLMPNISVAAAVLKLKVN